MWLAVSQPFGLTALNRSPHGGTRTRDNWHVLQESNLPRRDLESLRLPWRPHAKLVPWEGFAPTTRRASPAALLLSYHGAKSLGLSDGLAGDHASPPRLWLSLIQGACPRPWPASGNHLWDFGLGISLAPSGPVLASTVTPDPSLRCGGRPAPVTTDGRSVRYGLQPRCRPAAQHGADSLAARCSRASRAVDGSRASRTVKLRSPLRGGALRPR